MQTNFAKINVKIFAVFVVACCLAASCTCCRLQHS